MFKNASIYRVASMPLLAADNLGALLASVRFTPCAPQQRESIGFVPVLSESGLAYAVGQQLFLRLCVERKVLPPELVQRKVDEKRQEHVAATGWAPGKKLTAEIKERVIDEMLPTAPAVRSTTLAWLDPVNGWLVVDTSSAGRADEVIRLLLQSIQGFPVESFRLNRSPAACMTEWLQTDEAPASFTVDQDATLRATGESRAEIQFKNHRVDGADVRAHIAAGKQCVRLAMTWNDRVSFVLTESLTLKGIKALGILKESEQAGGFDGDMCLMAGELRQLFDDLTEALGGECAT